MASIEGGFVSLKTTFCEVVAIVAPSYAPQSVLVKLESSGPKLR